MQEMDRGNDYNHLMDHEFEENFDIYMKRQKLADNFYKLKILCLHGYRQNGDIFKQKIGALRTMLKKNANFYFVTAPLKIPPLDTDEQQTSQSSSNLEQYGWWFSDENCGFNSKKPSDVCIGFKQSLELITATFKAEGPFEGILGFSQGASFVSVLCGMHERECLPFDFKFAIMISGFKSLCSPHYKNYTKKIKIPTLHVYGETDQIIPEEMSEELTTYFSNPVKLVHNGGHYVPGTSQYKDTFVKFLEQDIMEPITIDSSVEDCSSKDTDDSDAVD